MDLFKSWLESADNVSAQADQYVQRVQGFVSTPDHPYPGHGSGTESDPLDLAAVVAGVKPAAGVSPEFIQSPLGQELMRRAKSSGMTASRGFGILGQEEGMYCVGRPQNVKAIVDAFKIVNRLDGWERRVKDSREASATLKQVMDAHETIGRNLGYPETAITKYRTLMTDYYKRKMPNVAI